MILYNRSVHAMPITNSVVILDSLRSILSYIILNILSLKFDLNHYFILIIKVKFIHKNKILVYVIPHIPVP